MGWSTDLFCNVSFSKETYDTKEKVEEELEECNSMIKYYQDELRDLALMTEPQKMLAVEENESIYFNISKTIKDDLEELEDYIIKKYKLQLLLYNWDKCHKNNLSIPLPDNIHYDDAFLEGDFIKSINDKENK